MNECNCKDCKYCKDGKCTYEESDLISRADTIRDINEWCININNPTTVVREDMMCILEEMPSIQAIDGKKLMGYITDWMCDLAPIEDGENYHDKEVKYQTLKEVRELIDALMRKNNEQRPIKHRSPNALCDSHRTDAYNREDVERENDEGIQSI